MNPLRPGTSRWAVIAGVVVVVAAAVIWIGSNSSGSTQPAGAEASTVSSSTTPPPAEPTSVGAETPEQAAALAAKVLADSVAAVQKPGAEGQAARDAVFAGPALVAANAENRLLQVTSAAEKEAKALTDAPSEVLAVSRGADYPRAMLVRTIRRQSNYPVLTLLVAPDAQRGYQVASSATLLSAAAVGSFTLVKYGSPFLADAAAVGPTAEAAFTEYARVLAYPAPAPGDVPFTDDAFAASVRQQAQAQAGALGASATLTQTRAYQGVPGGFQMLGDNGSLVFVVQERTDVLSEKGANALSPSAAFTLLSGKNVINTEAKQQFLEFLVFSVPPAGKASVVAAAQHLHAASGR
jgi:hypothetical protein